MKDLLSPAGFGSYSVTTAEQHDEMIAFTSQLAHVASNAYIKSPTAKKHKGFSAGSYKDMTRVAWLAPHMWAELFMENKEFLLKEIDCYIEHLSEYKTAMENDDEETLIRLLDEARRERKRWTADAKHPYQGLARIRRAGRARLTRPRGELLREVSAPGMAAIVSDDTVYALYGERTVKALEKAGYRVPLSHSPRAREQEPLDLRRCAALPREHRFSRSDVVVALGGGVVGDLAGFAAATYQRGMGFAQIPTTLLAAVDSSVGGKTAVDLPTGKNQAGSFYQPCIVICDPNTLETLPEEQYRCGCAEIIKYSMLGNAAFFEELYKTPVREQYEHVIEVCVQMKRDIVGADEYDLGRRRTLNLGHTFGHAVEQCSDFSLSARRGGRHRHGDGHARGSQARHLRRRDAGAPARHSAPLWSADRDGLRTRQAL